MAALLCLLCSDIPFYPIPATCKLILHTFPLLANHLECNKKILGVKYKKFVT